MTFHYRPFEDDVLLVGKGGSGKSYYLKHMILESCTYPLWLWDHRHQYGDLAAKGFTVTHGIEELPYGRAIYQPYNLSAESFDRFCAKADSWSNLVVAVEEAHLFTGKFKFYSESFGNIVRSGRPKGVTWIVISRRPQDVHNSILGDAEHIFCFEMELPSDVDYMRKWVGSEVELFVDSEDRPTPSMRNGQPRLPPHSFVHKDVNTGTVEIGRI